MNLPSIVVPTGTRGKIAALLNTSYKQVARALRGECVTPLHFLIRSTALSMGGLVIDDNAK